MYLISLGRIQRDSGIYNYLGKPITWRMRMYVCMVCYKLGRQKEVRSVNNMFVAFMGFTSIYLNVTLIRLLLLIGIH